MRNNFLKKKSKLTKIIVIFVMLIIVFYACREEIIYLEEKWHEDNMIEHAKAWYESNKPETPQLLTSDGTEQVPIKPEWTNVFETENENFIVVETDIMSKGRILYIDEGCREKYEETKDPKYNQCYTRIVFRTDKKTGKTVGFLMTVVPDLEWLEKSNFKPFMDVTYLFRNEQFGGMILFHEMDGRYANGWTYENGKIIYAIKSLDANPEGISLRSMVCHLEPVYRYTSVCTDWYTVNEFGGPDYYNGTTCHVETTLASFAQVCYDDGKNDDYIPPPPTPGGTGTGGNSTGSSSKAKKIFKNLNATQEAAIDKMLDKILTDCLGRALYDGLVSALSSKGQMLSFEFNNTDGSDFYYSISTISLSMSMESNQLFHEMWHAYQAYQETSSSYTNSLMNQEIEARYAQYLYVRNLPEYAGSKWETWYTRDPLCKSIAWVETFVSPKGKLQPGMEQADLNAYLTQQRSTANGVSVAGGPVFYLKATSSYFQMQYNSQFDNFKNLTNLAKNC